jgi:cell division protein FtsN
MKKFILFGAAICCILMFGSCKSKQSAYKKAYEQAKSYDEDFDEVDRAEVKTTENVSYEPVRLERVQALSGENESGLKRYSVVIGSFKVKTNAYGLKERMLNEGYKPVIAESLDDKDFLRVIVASFDSRDEAVRSRDSFKKKYAPNFNDAWILERRN